LPVLLSGKGIAFIHEYTLHQTELILKWVTVCGYINLIFCRPFRLTHPGHLFANTTDGDGSDGKNGEFCIIEGFIAKTAGLVG